MSSRRTKPARSDLPRPLRGKTRAELDAIADQFDQEFVADASTPASKTERARFERARSRGRPKVGEGAQKVNVSIERELLRRVMQAAEGAGISRSQLVALALVAVLPPGKKVNTKRLAERLRQVADGIEAGTLPDEARRRLAALLEAA